MVDKSARLASESERYITGENGFWLFIFGDMAMFSLLFALFLFGHRQSPEVYVKSATLLNETSGAVNTVLLLSSSLCVVAGVGAVRNNLEKIAFATFCSALALGVCFMAIKAHEYYELFNQGINWELNEFWVFYFVLTNLHYLHVVIGIVLLFFVVILVVVQGQGLEAIAFVEGAGGYWHFVDLLWVIIFPLLYLLF